jgi:hypothetical protein
MVKFVCWLLLETIPEQIRMGLKQANQCAF